MLIKRNTKKQTIKYLFEKSNTWFALFNCGHWIQYMSTIKPDKKLIKECPECKWLRENI